MIQRGREESILSYEFIVKLICEFHQSILVFSKLDEVGIIGFLHRQHDVQNLPLCSPPPWEFLRALSLGRPTWSLLVY